MRLLAFTLITSFLTLSASKKNAQAWSLIKASNGMDIISMPSSKVPLVTIVLAAKAGAFTETPDINGLTHLWEHMFFKGNQNLPNQEAFNTKVRQLGIVFNGDTSDELVRYYFTLPSAHLDEGLKFMADAISTPLLEASELEKERKVVLDEYERAASQPGFELGNISRMILYGDLEHSRNALGRKKIIEAATKEQLLRIKKEVFVPKNSALIVAGDFDSTLLPEKINQVFSQWTTPPDWKPVKKPNYRPLTESKEVIFHHPLMQNATLRIIYTGPGTEYAAKDTYVADALVSLLDHRSGKFYKRYIDSGVTLNTIPVFQTERLAGEILLHSVVLPKNYASVRDQFYQEPKEWLKKDYFTNEQLQDVKRKLVISRKFELNKPSDYGKNLAFWWGAAGMDYLAGYIASMNNVTLADVRGFVEKYFINKPRLTTVLVNTKEAEAVGLQDNSKVYSEQFLKNY